MDELIKEFLSAQKNPNKKRNKKHTGKNKPADKKRRYQKNQA
jgi:hypothetical protein